jgi:hypothetical protein
MTKQRGRKGELINWSAFQVLPCWCALMVAGPRIISFVQNTKWSQDCFMILLFCHEMSRHYYDSVELCELYICFRSCPLLVENAIVLPEETMVTGQ